MTAIEKAQERLREMREQGITPERLNPIQKAKRNPQSKQAAINAKCYECMGGDEETAPDPGWKDAIRGCTSTTCPLIPHRPYR